MTARPSRCPRDLLTEYVHGRLPRAAGLPLERHLVVCPRCRATVEEERALLLVLRSPGPRVPRDLQASLLSLATTDGAAPGPRLGVGAPAVPPPPRAPRPALAPLPVVDVRAPAQHRSPVRAAVTAGFAASATAVAALGLGAAAPTAGAIPSAPSQRTATVGSTSARPATRAVLAGFTVSTVGERTAVGGATRTSAHWEP